MVDPYGSMVDSYGRFRDNNFGGARVMTFYFLYFPILCRIWGHGAIILSITDIVIWIPPEGIHPIDLVLILL